MSNMIRRLKIHQSSQNKALKRFGIISAIIFSIIVFISIININTCSPTDCNSVYLRAIQLIVLSAGFIGTGYALLTLKSFDDKEIDYNDVIDKLEDIEDNKDLSDIEKKELR